MNKMQGQVREFHETYAVPIRDGPGIPSFSRRDLRISLIEEELLELEDAFDDGDIVAVADALGDLLYVVYGAALECGLDMEPITDEIHRSNMSKLGADGKPIYGSNGKVLKGPNYTPPNLKEIVDGLSKRP